MILIVLGVWLLIGAGCFVIGLSSDNRSERIIGTVLGIVVLLMWVAVVIGVARWEP